MTELWTASEVAARLQCKPAYIYELARRRAIPHLRLGPRYVRFEPERIAAWIAAQTIEPTERA